MVSNLNSVTQLNLCPSSNDYALYQYINTDIKLKDQLEESIIKEGTTYLLYASLKAANFLLNESNDHMVKEQVKAYILAYNGLINEEDIINHFKSTSIENPNIIASIGYKEKNIDIYDIVSGYIIPKDQGFIKHLTDILSTDNSFFPNADRQISTTRISPIKYSYYFYININISKIYEWYLEHKAQIEFKERLKIENIEFVNNYFLTQLTTMIANGHHEYINSLCIYNLNLVEHGDLVAHLIGLSL